MSRAEKRIIELLKRKQEIDDLNAVGTFVSNPKWLLDAIEGLLRSELDCANSFAMRDCCDEKERPSWHARTRKLRMHASAKSKRRPMQNRHEKREMERKTDEYLALLQQEERGQ